MKKIILSLLLSVSLLLPSITAAQAQIEIIIPSEEEVQELNRLQLERITSFLEDYGIVQKCLRRNQEERTMTKLIATCSVLQVFDQDQKTTDQWERAKALGLVNESSEKSETINALQYLGMLFKAAGVTISPQTEKNYAETFRKLRLRLGQEESKILATALDTGLFYPPFNAKEAAELKKYLVTEDVMVQTALAYLYQVATSQHQDAPLTQAPTETFGNNTIVLEDILKEVFNIIKTQSYFNENFDEKKAMEAAIKAAVKSLEEDKYIEYYTTDEFESFSEGLNGSLEGIGAYIEEKEGQIIIVSPIEGSPAQKAGILPGDIILLIDGVSTEGLSLQQAVNKIRGPQGTSVNLKIKRNGSEYNYSITRNKITVPALTVTSRDNIEIIKLVQFGNTSAQEMKAELETIAAKNPQGIIIDLRNNPGGFLNEVVTIVDFFLEKGEPIVYLQDKYQRTSMNATLDPIVKDIPISILINKGSASASEILAGVLQSYGIAKIYGETSFGKGTVQNIVSLQSAYQTGLSAFKFTTAEYLIPSANGGTISIDGVGVVPDSNPDSGALLDDRETVQDEALDAVINLMKPFTRRR
jgi:C-terminal peptidase prc